MSLREIDRVIAYIAAATIVIVLLAFAGLIARGFLYPEIVVINELGGSVPAALDIGSCEVLARQQIERPSQDIHGAYARAVRERGIIYLPNHATLREHGSDEDHYLNYTDERLIPFRPHGNITSEEAATRHIAAYEWLTIEEGPLKGKRACVATSMRRLKYPPL